MAAVLVLNIPDDGRLRPKHLEWPCRNKTCTVLHQVGVSFVRCSNLSMLHHSAFCTPNLCTVSFSNPSWFILIQLTFFVCYEPSVSSQRQHLPSDHELKFLGSNPGRGKKFFCSPIHPDRDWGPTSVLFCGYWGSFPGGKAEGEWSWPLSCILCQGYEWVELYLSSPYVPTWRGLEKYYLLIPRRSVPVLKKTLRFRYKDQSFSGIWGK